MILFNDSFQSFKATRLQVHNENYEKLENAEVSKSL